MLGTAKPIIAHYNDVFYHKSETFINNYISNARSYHPIYFAREFSNVDLFPLPEKDRYALPANPPRRYTGEWLYYGIARRYFKVNFSNEEIVLRQKKVKLIHAHFGPQGYFALKLRGRLKIPLITTFYGYDVSELGQDPQWVEQYQSLFKEGDLFLVEGEHMKSKLSDLGCPVGKIAIQRIAIPVSKIEFKPRRKKDGRKTVFLFAGRFFEKKGLGYALQAVNRLREKHDNFEFRIIGDGPLRPEMEDFIKENDLTAIVHLTGFLNYDEYLREMRDADIFLHPSVTAINGDSEGGAPTTILEAQASGMPVVSTVHADIPNIVAVGKSALLSKERDADALADNMAHLLDHQSEWEERGKAGRQFVEKYHDVEKEIFSLEEKYKALVGK
jgi:colanic acid/amylovoran biosynthesis glycosyltransferase